MKHVIIGMAGHVDHGKTELVKALTGVDTDRLAEEKKRGITIDLGFARLDFPDGSCASIVDVPGHERFIKNMLAGAGGVDLAMLVVAADEGFMPQTVEHLDILQLLGVKGGLIVLTKADLVDEDWLNMLEEDVKSRVKGTFLEDKPILRTSVRTGEGVEALREALHDLTLHAEEKSARTPFRLPIDRVFPSTLRHDRHRHAHRRAHRRRRRGAAHAARESVPRAQFAGARARRVGGVRRTARGGQLSGHQKREHQPRRCAVQDGFDAAVADAGRETAKSAGF